MADSLQRLYEAVLTLRDRDPDGSRTSRLLQAGKAKMAKKLAEEAVEVVIDAMKGDHAAVVRESADLLYNLTVLWVSAGVAPSEVFAEMDRREQEYGLAEKQLKQKLSKGAPVFAVAPAMPGSGVLTQSVAALPGERRSLKRR